MERPGSITHGQLCRVGTRVGRQRVARLMAELDLVGVHSRKKWRRGRLDVAPLRTSYGAILQRQKVRSTLGGRHHRVHDRREGKLFLAGVKDLYGRGLVGWSMGTRQTSELVIEAVSMAVAAQGSGDPAAASQRQGMPIHLARLHQPTARLGLVPSYGSTGDCYDNAAMETFWATLKRELSWIHGPLIYMNRARLRSALFDYIEIFYNRERAQAGLGHLSPLDYEAAPRGGLNPTNPCPSKRINTLGVLSIWNTG